MNACLRHVIGNGSHGISQPNAPGAIQTSGIRMRLKHIEAFNALMLTGTVSGAARLLHVTQPAMTQTLQHAELQLGYQLFLRQRNRLVPTTEAQALYPDVQRLMTQLEEVRRLASALGSGKANPGLRVLIVPSLAVRALPDALTIFRRRYKDTPIAIRTLHSNEIARAMALQEGDVGIVYGNVMHGGLQEEHVATGRLVCVSQLLQRGSDRRTTVALSDVLKEPFIRIDERDPLGAMLADQWSRLGMAPMGGMTVQTHHIAMVLAEQGFGPAIIDSFTAQARRSDTLHVRSITPEIPVEVRALIPRGVCSPRPIADFIAAMKTAIAHAAG
jgi:DNA-binding transcriptional LysR family regulator